jgi:hypothetical protein
MKKEQLAAPTKEQAQEKVTLTATENTTLADGTFVAKGEKVEVTKEYADRIELEKNKSFIK